MLNHLPDKGRRPKDLFDEMSHDHSLGIGRNGKSLVYDDKRGAVLIPERVPTTDGGQMQRISVFKPGKEGILNLDFYLPLRDDDLPPFMDPTVEKVLNTLAFEPEFASNDLAEGESPPLGEDIARALRRSPTALPLLVLGLVGIIGSVLKARHDRKAKREQAGKG